MSLLPECTEALTSGASHYFSGNSNSTQFPLGRETQPLIFQKYSKAMEAPSDPCFLFPDQGDLALDLVCCAMHHSLSRLTFVQLW